MRCRGHVDLHARSIVGPRDRPQRHRYHGRLAPQPSPQRRDAQRRHIGREPPSQPRQRPTRSRPSRRRNRSLPPSPRARAEHGAAHNNLGNALRDGGSLPEAAADYQRALELDPAFFAAAANLAHVLAKLPELPRAEILAAHDRALALATTANLRTPDVANLHNARGNLLQADDRTDDAIACYRTAIAPDPNFAEATSTSVAPSARNLHLDEAIEPLRRALELRPTDLAIYKQLALALRRLRRNDEATEVYQARRRGGYDELLEAELTEMVESRPNAFDLIVAADVLTYFGQLDRLTKAFRRALRPNGALVFTAEAGADEPRGWELNEGGRYAHHDTYLRRVLEQTGFEVCELSNDRLRYELGTEVRGWVVAAMV